MQNDETVHVRQSEIQQDYIRPMKRGFLQAQLPVSRLYHGVAAGPQCGLYVLYVERGADVDAPVQQFQHILVTI